MVSETFRPQSVTLGGVEPRKLQKPNEELFGVVNGRIKKKKLLDEVRKGKLGII